jgi:dihydrodipicolinate synthase/N-acetylneuraminate lyase
LIQATSGQGISILDENDKLLPEVYKILEIIAQSETVLGTGHLSIKETDALLSAAQEIGAKRSLVTQRSIWRKCTLKIRSSGTPHSDLPAVV